jgi:hypothetical protein
MSNKLYVGFNKEIELPKRGGFLLIDDEVRDIPRSRVFDPLKHSLNPLKDISYKRAREIAEIIYTVYPQGENTLTVRNGKRVLLAELLSGWKAKRLDKIQGDEEVGATIRDLLMSPILKKVLCNPTNFSFNPRSVIQARINRAELGDFDALVLGLILMAYYKGQVVLVDGGFYLRELHVSLIRERRLTVGCNFLSELPPKIRQNVLLFDQKVASRARLEDAELLAEYSGLVKGTNAFNDFVGEAIS